ncbi:MAG: hypothetical protein ABIO24_13150 [Saprospiraceae bacterium]
MLQNWLKPLSAAMAKNLESPFSNHVLLHREQFPDLKKVRVAIIGLEEKSANLIREQLYRMAWHFPKNALADLGNLRKPEPGLLLPVVYELLAGKVIPLLIGGPDDLARAQFLAYQEMKTLANLVVVQEHLALTDPKSGYAPLLIPRHPSLFHFSLIGYQIHQTPSETLEFLTENNFDSLRLGRSRAALEETEPLIRDADTLAFHLGALKQCEAPGVLRPSPSGFFAEEACQLGRYAGLSDKLTSFGIYGYQREADPGGQTAQVIAQMMWYFLEGFFSRKNDYPVSTAGLTEYIVHLPRLSHHLTFWKSAKSGRWWMQIPVATKRKHDRHRLVPCSFQDYQATCREELPERLLAALQRFS